MAGMLNACANSGNLAAWPQVTSHTLESLPPGPEGTAATLARMRGFSRAAAMTPQLRNLALSIVDDAQVDAYDYEGEARALQQWVQDNITYRRDVAGVETLTPPAYTLGQGAGDCDDQSMLMAALAMAVGLPARFVAAGRRQGLFEHVWSEVYVSGAWTAVETTRPVDMGTSPDWPYRITVNVTDDAASLGDFWSNVAHGVESATHTVGHVVNKAAQGFWKATVRDPIKGLEDLRHGGKTVLHDWFGSFGDAVDFAHDITPKFVYRTFDKALPVIQTVGQYIPVYGWAVSLIASAAQIGLKVNAAKAASADQLAKMKKNAQLNARAQVMQVLPQFLETPQGQVGLHAIYGQPIKGVNWNDPNIELAAAIAVSCAVEAQQSTQDVHQQQTAAAQVATKTCSAVGIKAPAALINAAVAAVPPPSSPAGSSIAAPGGAVPPDSLPVQSVPPVPTVAPVAAPSAAPVPAAPAPGGIAIPLSLLFLLFA